MMRPINYRLMLVLACLLPGVAAAHAADATHGKALAETNCMKCHAIGADGASPEPRAVPFREIAVEYDAADLEDSFNEGVASSHEIMPDWQMSPEQAADLAAYVMSLRPAAAKQPEQQ